MTLPTTIFLEDHRTKGRNGAKAKEAGQACHTVSCLLNFGRVTQV